MSSEPHNSDPIPHIYVSLGSDCSIAYQLSNYNLRQKSYPFDWVRTPNLNTFIDIIKDRFSKYTAPLRKVCESSTDIFPVKPQSENQDIKKKVLFVMENSYKVRFFHDYYEDSDHDEVSLDTCVELIDL